LFVREGIDISSLDESMRTTAKAHKTIRPEVLSFGTPVVLISKLNPDGTANLAPVVAAIALSTGTEIMPPGKSACGYCYEPAKFARAALTPVASDLVGAPRVDECPIQVEAKLELTHAVGGPDSGLVVFEVRIVRTHVGESLIVPESDSYIHPEREDPLIMKFCEYYGHGSNVRESELARVWSMPAIHRCHAMSKCRPAPNR